MADDDSSGSKYAYLLQPIKDLEKNFAIDLVSLLETYTQELGDLAEAEEFQRNNAHRFNFAEAGMLIHGSAAVLAKKVDLVHSHALNFFQVLQNAKPKKKNHDSDDGDEGIGGDDDDDPFTAATIDPCVLKDCSRLKTTNLSSLVSKNPNTAIPSISIMPMSLMPLADFEKCNVPIYNSKNKNEVVGKKDDFKINTGYMSRSGALLLDLLNEALVDQFMTQQQKMPESSGEDSGRCSPVDDPASEMNLPQLPCSQEFDSGRPSNAVEIVRRAAGPSMDVAQIPRPSSVFLNADGKPSQPLEVLAEANFSDMDTGGGFDDNDVTPTPLVRKADPWDVDDMEIDPLLELHDDPFEEVLWKSKPYNKSNNCLNLEAILARRKKADERKDRKEKLMETIEFVNDEIYCLGKKQKIKRQIGLGTQYKWEIDAILPYISNQQKRRDKVRREMLAQRRLDEKLALRGKKNARALPEFDEDDDYADGFDDEPTHFCDNAPNYVPAETISRPLMATVDDADLAENIAFPAIIYDPASQNSEAGAHVNRIVHDEIHEDMTLEEIITFYRKKYWEQTAEAMSKLAARVQEWDEKMQPLLEEEETRKEFSIHAYGTELLAFFNKLDDVRTLPELLKGKVNYEISRYFLSTLMMANTMNLEIINEQQMGPDPLKMMRMKLLTRERHHEIFEGNGDL